MGEGLSAQVDVAACGVAWLGWALARCVAAPNMEVYGSGWVSQSSKLLRGGHAVVGGFDSHTPLPEISEVTPLYRYLVIIEQGPTNVRRGA